MEYSRNLIGSRVLRHQHSFAVLNEWGDVEPGLIQDQGLFFEDMRHLSFLQLLLQGAPPVLLTSSIRRDNSAHVVDLTNREFECEGRVIAGHTVHVRREQVLWGAALCETISFWNAGQDKIAIEVSLGWESDFCDIFELKEAAAPNRRERRAEVENKSRAALSCRGRDGLTRSTTVELAPQPSRIDVNRAAWTLSLARHQTTSLVAEYQCINQDSAVRKVTFSQAKGAFLKGQERISSTECRVSSSNEQFNAWLDRSSADLRMLTTDTRCGLYPFAGIPWFNTTFGRDGLITAWQALWFQPKLARGVLKFLAVHQAQEMDDAREAQPGKIMHEARLGELARTGVVPYGRYYGSVDSTPLFLVLLAEYVAHTGDKAFVRELEPHIWAAYDWIEKFGDSDGDGFVEYERRAESGLVNHCWRDSDNAYFHSDGRPAAGAIAACEVQAYTFQALIAAKQICRALDAECRAERYAELAERLSKKFHEAFWVSEKDTYALALDGEKSPCQVESSCAGQVLLTDIAPQQFAPLIARRLMSKEMFSGWGVRTVAQGEARYNPMSYHNGSIWPHDNALIALGLARHGMKAEVQRIFNALFDVSVELEFHRLPELWCGFEREESGRPTLYPVACSPQAWSAGSVFMLIRASLGLEIDGEAQTVRLENPVLPDFLSSLTLAGLEVGPGRVDITLVKYTDDVGVHVENMRGDVTVEIWKRPNLFRNDSPVSEG